MTKTTKIPKPLTVESNPNKVKRRIRELENELKGPISHTHRNELKEELRTLTRLRHKQKNYTPPPKKVNLKKGL